MVNTNEVVTKVKEMLGENVEVSVTNTDKGNGVIYTGILVKESNSNIAPVIYLDPKSEDVVAEASRIVTMYQKSKADGAVAVDFFRDYSQVKEKLGIKLSSQPAEGLVKQIAFADIYMTAYVKVNVLGEEGSIGIKEEHIKEWGIDADTLFKDALMYAQKNHPVSTQSLSGFVKGMVGFEIDEEPEELKDILILTNEEKAFGASAIMYFNKPKEFYMLPSSVHELLLMPATPDVDEHGLTDMVKVVNETQVAPEERLADHAYHYINGEFKIIE